MESEGEFRHHPEVPAATPQSPGQVCVHLVAGGQDFAIGRDHLEGHHVVTGHPELASQPAHAAAKR